MVRISTLIAALLLGAAASSTVVEGADLLRVGLNESPPLAYTTGEGKAEGFLARYSQSLIASAGMKAEIGVFPAPRLFQALQEGQLDFSLLVRAPVLEACCLYSSAPIMTHVLRAYTLGSTPPAHTADELTDKSIILLHGYSYAGLAGKIQDGKRNNRVEIAKSFAAAFRMLESRRADYLLAYEANAAELLAERAVPELRSEAIARYPVFLVLNRRYPDADNVLKRLEILASGMEKPVK